MTDELEYLETYMWVPNNIRELDKVAREHILYDSDPPRKVRDLFEKMKTLEQMEELGWRLKSEDFKTGDVVFVRSKPNEL